jgi:hypothetical protein
MQLGSEIRELAARLAERRHKSPFTLFLGSGCAQAAGVPDVKQMALKTFGDMFDAGTGASAKGAERYISSDDYWAIAEDPTADDEVLLVAFYRLLADMSSMGRYRLLRRYYQDVPVPRFYQDAARLVRDGYFYHVLTTNIDTLFEKALNDCGLYEGPDYAVINPAAPQKRGRPAPADGKERVTVVKLYGDLAGPDFALSPAEIEEMLWAQRRSVEAEFAGDIVVVGYDFQSEPVTAWLRSTDGDLWWLAPDPPGPELAAFLDQRSVRLIGEPSAHPEAFFGGLAALIEASALGVGPGAGEGGTEQEIYGPGEEEEEEVLAGVMDEDESSLWGGLSGEEDADKESFERLLLRRQLRSSEAAVSKLSQQSIAPTESVKAQLKYERSEISRMRDEIRGQLSGQVLLGTLAKLRDAVENAGQDPSVVGFMDAQLKLVQAEYETDDPNQDVVAAAVGATVLIANRLDLSFLDRQWVNMLEDYVPGPAKGVL